MTRVAPFNSPLLLGFGQIERLLDRASKSAGDGFPPYNIEQFPLDNGEGYRITLAVAGFTRDGLSLTLEKNQLVVRGRQTEEAGRVYLHRGIAARQFQRTFVLAEGVEVTSARLENGLLVIELVRPEPHRIVMEIEIEAGDSAASSQKELSVVGAARSA